MKSTLKEHIEQWYEEHPLEDPSLKPRGLELVLGDNLWKKFGEVYEKIIARPERNSVSKQEALFGFQTRGLIRFPNKRPYSVSKQEALTLLVTEALNRLQGSTDVL